MMGVFKLPWLNVEKRVQVPAALKPGHLASSLVFGMTFAFGWTPCVGPIFGTVLTLAALGAASASRVIARMSKALHAISVIDGAFLVFLGVLLLTDNLATWVSLFYQAFDFTNYDTLLDYL